MVCVLAKFVTYTYVSSLCAVVAVAIVVAGVALCDVVVLVARVVLPAVVVAAVVDFLCADEDVAVCSWWLRLLDLLDLCPAVGCSLCLERLE